MKIELIYSSAFGGQSKMLDFIGVAFSYDLTVSRAHGYGVDQRSFGGYGLGLTGSISNLQEFFEDTADSYNGIPDSLFVFLEKGEDRKSLLKKAKELELITSIRIDLEGDDEFEILVVRSPGNKNESTNNIISFLSFIKSLNNVLLSDEDEDKIEMPWPPGRRGEAYKRWEETGLGANEAANEIYGIPDPRLIEE